MVIPSVSVVADPFVRTITVLPVRSIDESTDWYRQALGFDVIYLHEGTDPGEETNYAVLRRGQLDVHLILDEPLPHAWSWTKSGVGYLYLMVRDVDAIYAEVKSRGIPIERELQVEIWGARAFNLRDPSGNAIHIEQEQA